MSYLLASLFVLLLVLLAPATARAQITLSNTFVPGDTIYSSQVNTNFTQLSDNALNRTGGTITGNINVNAGVTIDGVDLSIGIPWTVLAKTANYTVTTSDGANCLILGTGTFTVTLYAASGNAGRCVTVKNIGTGVLTVDANASETIDGALTKTISARYQSLTLVCDGSNWHLA